MAIAIAAVPTFLILGDRWQGELRDIFGIEVGPALNLPLGLFIAGALAFVLLQAGRGLRWVARKVAQLFSRFLPLPAARLIAFVAVAALTVTVINGTLVRGTLDVLRNIYGSVDETTDDGVVAPEVAQRSGSAESLVSWDSLGRQGRSFVAGGPTQQELASFAAKTTSLKTTTIQQPIRVYAGLKSADTPEQIADLVVKELDRTNAWDREILAVTTATGTGWIDPSFSMALEYQHGGNSAIASMQYSYLPSWIGFVSDRGTPQEAGRVLFDAIYAKWSTLPKDKRPYLLTYGLSLGSYGAQGAFSGLQDLESRTDGALFVGTPNFTPLWSDLTASRDRGSPQYSPILNDGKQVRWTTTPNSTTMLWRLGQDWGPQRTIYVQHASDAVVWWSPDLLWEKPDWLRDPPGPDRTNSMGWIPIVTFWQVTFDLFVAGDVPIGHGHAYHLEYPGALAALGAPQEWTSADTTALETLMATIPSEN